MEGAPTLGASPLAHTSGHAAYISVSLGRSRDVGVGVWGGDSIGGGVSQSSALVGTSGGKRERRRREVSVNVIGITRWHGGLV